MYKGEYSVAARHTQRHNDRTTPTGTRMTSCRSRRLAASLAGAMFLTASACVQRPERANSEWHAVTGDSHSTKYSAADQITPDNIRDLALAWTWQVGDVEQPTGYRTQRFRATPLMVNGRLYLSTGLNLVVALDPGTGRLLWSYDPRAYDFPIPADRNKLESRGVAYWAGDLDNDGRLVFATGTLQLLTLTLDSGQLYPEFGDQGIVDLSRGLGVEIDREQYNIKSPPTVCRDTVVVGAIVNDQGYTQTMSPGHVRGYDVRTGEMKWIFHTIPQEGEFGVETWEEGAWRYTGSTNVWSMMSCDEELGYVYLPIGTPTNDWYGGHRLGDNLFAESLVALEAETGNRVWHFQGVHHGVWDYDFPAPPNLVDITVDGRPIKAVAQLSKQAFTYVFDRVTGKPVWPIEERPVPQSTVPGERMSPTQPFPTRPPPFDRQGLAEDDLIDFTPALRTSALEIVRDFVLGPLFTPPIVAGENGKEGVIQVPGIMGGANWPGGAFDPESGILYVQSSTFPFVTALTPGNPDESDLRYTFEDWAREPPWPRVPLPGGGLSAELPLVKPPYSRLTAIDLNSGEIVWQVPHGDGPREAINELLGNDRDVGPLGLMSATAANASAPLVTKTLLFTTQRNPPVDRSAPTGVMRAFDKATGEMVWERMIGTEPDGAPMTYAFEGKQYFVFATGGGDHPRELRAYALASRP